MFVQKPTRRAFFTRSGTPLRPPWALPEADFQHACSRCGACIDACREGILVRESGAAGFPMVSFQHGACSFCRACVDACPAAALSPQQSHIWSAQARVHHTCMAQHGVICRSCAEYCDTQAILFSADRVPQPQIDAAQCTGCGACVAICPAQAISVA